MYGGRLGLRPLHLPAKCCDAVRLQWRKTAVLCKALTYNHFTNTGYVFDVALGPLFWLLDNYVRYFGPAFVAFLVAMLSFVVVMTYLIVIPYELTRKSYLEIVVYLVLGHWLLINTVFNYFMAYLTDPGQPSDANEVYEAVGFCRHCITPKPPRTHHCRICNRCILKMDHHCPWLNQCVGHFNHRYFVGTMFFIWLSCLVVCVGMYPTFSDHFFSEGGEITPWCEKVGPELFYSDLFCNVYAAPPPSEAVDLYGEFDEVDQQPAPHVLPATEALADQSGPVLQTDQRGQQRSGNSTKEEEEEGEEEEGRVEEEEGDEEDVVLLPRFDVGLRGYHCILVEYCVCLAVVLAVGGLLAWHGYLASKAETSIEQHINRETRRQWKKQGKTYKNPYDFGVANNWRILWGLNQPGVSFLRHILFPSRHKPADSGFSWTTATYTLPEEKQL